MQFKHGEKLGNKRTEPQEYQLFDAKNKIK
jgi:hypothetical protein